MFAKKLSRIINTFKSSAITESRSSLSLSSQVSSNSKSIGYIPNPKSEKIDSCMELKKINLDENGKAPLAILFAWLNAKERHLDHYRKLYFAHGFDVLTVRVSPMQLMLPKKGSQVVAQKVLDFLQSTPNHDKFVIHTFSVGAYLFGEMLLQMRNQEEDFYLLKSKITGLVMDSSVDVMGLPHGLSRSLSSRPSIIKALETYASTHMALFYNVSTKYYFAASKAFHENDLKCPSLFFASRDDFVGSYENAERAANKWAEKGSDVAIKIWENSSHVSHLNNHRHDYSEAIHNLLTKIGYESIHNTEKECIRDQ